MIYFTSDMHLGHENILRFANRPFESVQEMNNTLIANYNALVREEDTVYILGDLAYRIPLAEANEIIAGLNGKKHLIAGNHDKKYDESLFEEVVDYRQLHTNGKHFTLMHYPMLEWEKMRCGSIMLHGHMHNIGMDYNIECKKNGIRRFDVGVDANGFYPVAITTIIDFIDNVDTVPFDL